jgi:ABC-type spermidine/putrescine transport system permease subunit II
MTSALEPDPHALTVLAPRWRNLLLSIHVLVTVGAFGADLVLMLLGTWSALGADPRAVYPAAHLIGQVLVLPLAIVSLVTGVALALLTGWGLLRFWWTAIKLAVTLALTAVVWLVLVPRLGAAAEAATLLGSQAFTAAERVPLMLAPALGSSLLALNVALAIYKPRWRLREAPARSRHPEFA